MCCCTSTMTAKGTLCAMPGTSGRSSELAFRCREQRAAHIPFDHPQCGIAQLVVDVGDHIRGDDHLEVPHVGVKRAVENALFGDLAREDDPVDAELAEQILQRGRIERAVTD